jgi:hypothetical protein
MLGVVRVTHPSWLGSPLQTSVKYVGTHSSQQPRSGRDNESAGLQIIRTDTFFDGTTKVTKHTKALHLQTQAALLLTPLRDLRVLCGL